MEHKGFFKVDTPNRRRMTDLCKEEDPLLCEYKSNLIDQYERIDRFMEDVAPLMDYVRAEIKRNDNRSRFYSKVTENVLGASIFAIFGAIGYWVLAKFKEDIGMK
jgi:hypothetical protein